MMMISSSFLVRKHDLLDWPKYIINFLKRMLNFNIITLNLFCSSNFLPQTVCSLSCSAWSHETVTLHITTWVIHYSCWVVYTGDGDGDGGIWRVHAAAVSIRFSLIWMWPGDIKRKKRFTCIFIFTEMLKFKKRYLKN